MHSSEVTMDIATFRQMKDRMLDKLTNSEQRQAAEIRINYTLKILNQETMSKEAIALIITNSSTGISTN